MFVIRQTILLITATFWGISKIEPPQLFTRSGTHSSGEASTVGDIAAKYLSPPTDALKHTAYSPETRCPSMVEAARALMPQGFKSRVWGEEWVCDELLPDFTLKEPSDLAGNAFAA